MTITLSPELERLVNQRIANGEFENVEDVLAAALQRLGTSPGPEPDHSASERTNVREAIKRIRQLRKGVTLGPGVTIRQLIEEGRRY